MGVSLGGRYTPPPPHPPTPEDTDPGQAPVKFIDNMVENKIEMQIVFDGREAQVWEIKLGTGPEYRKMEYRYLYT